MIANNLPILHVIIPLIAAALCPILKSKRLSWLTATSACWLSFSGVILLFLSALKENVTTYEYGNWFPPIGIEYRIDLINAFVLLLVTFIGAVMAIYAGSSIKNEIKAEKHSLFYSTYLLCFAGLLGILSTNDVFNIYVFLEISSLSTYALISMGKNRKALSASFEYLILGTIGATFILIGIGFLYMMTGTLNITDMSERILEVGDTRPVKAAFAFLTLGLALKIAMFPLHIWLTNAYSYAPSFISAFLSATATKVSIYVFIRIIFTLFGYEYSFLEMPLGTILITMAVAGIFVGSLTAIYQTNAKRLLAFSSVAQVGYIILGIGIATGTGLTASILHIANHAFAKGLLFLAVGSVFLRAGGCNIENFRGISRQMPITMISLVIGGLSLIGVPGTAGFVSKWYFLNAFIEKDLWPMAFLLLFSSVLAVIYMWKIIEVAFFGKRPKGAKKLEEAPLLMLLSMWALIVANIYFGIYTDITLDAAQAAANNLLGEGA